MPSLELSNIRKAYGETLVLDGVSLTMEAKEFVAFLGPSGSGKSTLLRIIAGLERADSGEVRLEGERIDQRPPGERGVAMVFQHYALYPHMTVRENMAFGLRNAKVPKDEIEARVADAARVLEIEEHLDKKPGQMSGGQRQRVAIGRAIVARRNVPVRRAAVQPRRGLRCALGSSSPSAQRSTTAVDHGHPRPARHDSADGSWSDDRNQQAARRGRLRAAATFVPVSRLDDMTLAARRC